jgi:hypothetical protein
MEKLNTTSDTIKYLNFGNLTQPFMDNNFVLNKVLIDHNLKLKTNPNHNLLESLCLWINKNVKHSDDPTFCNTYKFQRTAEEIWNSGLATGCTDYCLLFATFARQIEIPTTFLHTAEKNWLARLKNNEGIEPHSGHAFCECFYEGEWVLVDPTCKRHQSKYDAKFIHLEHNVNGYNEFIPYLRDLDLTVKQSIKEYNKLMDKLCLKLNCDF